MTSLWIGNVAGGGTQIQGARLIPYYWSRGGGAFFHDYARYIHEQGIRGDLGVKERAQ